jgi:hypothetical protein
MIVSGFTITDEQLDKVLDRIRAMPKNHPFKSYTVAKFFADVGVPSFVIGQLYVRDEAANRTLQKLRKANIIKYDGGYWNFT